MVSQNTIREMAAKIAERFDPERIILFGSYARGDATENSDVDLLVVMAPGGSQRDVQAQIRNILLPYPTPIDVFIRTPDVFHRHATLVNSLPYFARQDGMELYARGSG